MGMIFKGIGGVQGPNFQISFIWTYAVGLCFLFSKWAQTPLNSKRLFWGRSCIWRKCVLRISIFRRLMDSESRKNGQNQQKLQNFKLSRPKNQPKMKIFKIHTLKCKIYLKTCRKPIYSLFWPFSQEIDFEGENRVFFPVIFPIFSYIFLYISRYHPSCPEP